MKVIWFINEPKRDSFPVAENRPTVTLSIWGITVFWQKMFNVQVNDVVPWEAQSLNLWLGVHIAFFFLCSMFGESCRWKFSHIKFSHIKFSDYFCIYIFPYGFFHIMQRLKVWPRRWVDRIKVRIDSWLGVVQIVPRNFSFFETTHTNGGVPFQKKKNKNFVRFRKIVPRNF